MSKSRGVNMLISDVKIKNYRGLDIEVSSIEKVSILIGQNDSGKTNICSALLKVLDYNKRKIPFIATDSTNSNKEPIEIEITLTVDELTKEQTATIGKYIHSCNGKKYLKVKLISTFNNETLEYEDSLLYGDSEMDFEEVRVNTQTQLDKVLSIVYINPKYDVEISKKDYFKFKELSNKEDGKFFSDKISEELTSLNRTIQDEQITKEIQMEINEKGDFEELFENLYFKVTPNIKEENIYKSLNVNAYDDQNNEFDNIGDGKNKIFSTLLKSKTFGSNKQKIYIIEEPENHLYVLLQRMYISALLEMNPSQLLITTHSPYTIDFEKTNQIIKISYNSINGKRKIYKFGGIKNDDFKKFGYLINVEVSEMLYYDKILLVEGDSEKYFYSLLMSRDSNFLKKINQNKWGIYSVGGIAFKTVKEMLEGLGIEVYIKTDNDIFKVPNKNEYRYAGLERCMSYISQEGKNKFRKLLSIKKDEELIFRMEKKDDKLKIVEEKINDICSLLYEEKIIFSMHNCGFEKDLIDYLSLNEKNTITCESIEYLKEAKLKNLHNFIDEYKIEIKVIDNNKQSVLVRFFYD